MGLEGDGITEFKAAVAWGHSVLLWPLPAEISVNPTAEKSSRALTLHLIPHFNPARSFWLKVKRHAQRTDFGEPYNPKPSTICGRCHINVVAAVVVVVVVIVAADAMVMPQAATGPQSGVSDLGDRHRPPANS